MESKALLTSYTLGPYKLRSRVIMAPLTRCRAGKAAVPNSMMAKYYEQRSSAGFIISEATNISVQGTGYLRTPGIYSGEQIHRWKYITEAVHKKGGLIFCQLWHVGRHSHPLFQKDARLPVAPSAIKESGHVTTEEGKKGTLTPRALETAEIPQIVQQYRQAAINAMLAGFDGVEIHGANGYLIDQFIQDGTNQRQDEYGGSIENRCRFAMEVVEAVTRVWGPGKAGIRLSPSGIKHDMKDSNPKETFGYLIHKLNDYELSYLHVLEPWFSVDHLPNYIQKVTPFAREHYKGTLITNYGFDFDTGNAVIDRGEADLVSFGRLFISNPDLPERFASGAALTPWDTDTFYTEGEKGYVDYGFMDKAN